METMNTQLTATLSLIILYGYVVILPAAIIEGPIITVLAAFLAAQGYFNIFVVYAIVVIGDVIGDFMYYCIGRFGASFANTKFAQKIGITHAHIEKLHNHFKTNSGKTLLFGKWTHSMGLFVLTGAGVAKMPIGKFLWYNFLGTLPKSLLFLLIGYYVGYAYQMIDSYIAKGAFIMAILITLGVIVYMIRNRTHKTPEAPTAA